MTSQTLDPHLNFLSQRKKSLSEIEKTDRKYALWMSYVLGALIFLFILVSVANYIFSRRVRTVASDIETTTASISQESNIEQQYVILGEKLQFINSIIKERSTKRSAIEYFTTQFSTADTSLNEITYDQKGTIQFLVVAKNVFVLDEIMKTMQSSDVKQKFHSIHLSDLTRTPDGNYTVQVSVVLTAAAAATPEEE